MTGLRSRVEAGLRVIWSGHRPRRLTLLEAVAYCLLVPAAAFYAGLTWGWREIGRTGLMRRRRVTGLTVVSIGNITVGGTGKTPLVIGLARALRERDVRVAVVSRGYRAVGRGSGPLLVSDGSGPLVTVTQAGDEPVMIARAVPVPVIVSRDRTLGVRLARDRYRSEIVLLDDGYQHRRLERDADIVLLDAADPFGNGWTLPAGRLREPLSALREADLFILVHRGSEAVLPIPPRLARLLHALGRGAEVVSGVIRIEGLRPGGGGTIEPTSWLADRPVLLVSGIANPGAFENEIAGRGAQVVDHLRFGDHHAYSGTDIDLIRERRHVAGGEVIVTTAKDETKLVPAGLGIAEELWVAEAGFEPRTIDLIAGALT